jgi:ATP-dependent Clp protease protease subunit
MKHTWLIAAGFVMMGGVGMALFDTHVEQVEPDYEEQWDLLADSGNHSPHASQDRALLGHRSIVLSHDVNANAAHKVVTALLLLDKQAPGKPIDLYIRSNGGWIDDAFAIVDTIETLRSPVNTIAVGSTQSAGAMILVAGTGKRIAMPNAVIMVHENLSFDEEEFSQGMADRLREQDLWKRRARLPEAWFTPRGDFTRFLSPRQALEFGLIDEIAVRRSAPTDASGKPRAASPR